MNNVSIVGLIISVVLFMLFLIEFVNLFKSFKKGKRGYIPIHIIGLISAALITIFTITSSFGVQMGTNNLVTATVILTFICFIILGFESLKVEKIEKVRPRRVNRDQND